MKTIYVAVDEVPEDFNAEEITAVMTDKSGTTRVSEARIIAQPASEAVDRETLRREIINTPELNNFSEAIRLEAIHQRERWGTDHDEGKEPEDWLWLVAYLATKATQANRYGDSGKYVHHIITCAAACLNWHASATGTDTTMRVGPPVPAHEARALLASTDSAGAKHHNNDDSTAAAHAVYERWTK